MKNIFLAILMAFSLTSANAGIVKRYTINGYVYEKGSRESISGAIIFVNELRRAVQTNNYGYYSLSIPDTLGSVTLSISFIGYAPIIESVGVGGNQNLNFFMERSTNLKEVVVEGQRINIAEATQMSSIDIPIRELKNIPAIGGEKDIIKALQLLPGVQKGSEGSSGLYVRGGGPDQNLIILDDAPVYNASHLFGFFSTFNGDALKNANLIKGGFPARYGGRLSSVLDLTMKDGSKEKFSGEFGIGNISSRLVLEGPIKKGKSSYLISGRRTYIDALLQPLLLLVEKGLSSGYYFYDLNAKVNTEIDPNNKVYFSAYMGRDKFYFKYKIGNSTEKAGLYWGNLTSTTRWNHRFNKNLFANTSFIASDYTFKVYQSYKEGNDEFNLDYHSGIRDFTAKTDIDYKPFVRHSFKIGALATYHQFTPTAFVTKNSYDQSENIKKVLTLGSTETGVYVEDEWKPTTRSSTNLGLRWSSFMPGDKQYHFLEPRIGTRYLLKEDLSVKASYAVMNQFLHLLSNSTPGLPTDLWVPATAKVKPQHSEQVAFGLAKEFFSKGIELTIEGYYKKMNNIITYKEGASFFLEDPFAATSNNGNPRAYEENVTSGKGKSMGLEFFAKYDKGKFNGWAGYTLSRTTVQFAEVNAGKAYVPKYDRTHDISLVGSYEFSERKRLTATWVYGTGNAITLPIGNQPGSGYGSLQYGRELDEYGAKNAYRMLPYHRMDVSLQCIKKKKHGIRTWEYSIYNAYMHANPFFYITLNEDPFERNPSEESRLRLYRLSIFPLIPSVSYSYKF